ncbi:sulfatase-like hydrolase/transferase [Flammeovirga aprica]|uniref:Sulfatase-like hydrolase/transferase n=1 Tax=Flammeovirga aprica JL-4 TaxID=694437 RepID=A0A7X9P2P9_9BACT|nr:sulfatase-like hydrolase/transferase [Flammeovirga aprica]NME68466.1 sulfatase-like hydrolase/transferase [Flammeovirga aprica JL-4]
MKQLLLILLLCSLFGIIQAQDNPNILLIIADDMGADVTPGYGIGRNLPTTPNLDALRASGVTFTNVWATPVCAATRATIMTGKYGVNNGVPTVPGELSTDHKTIFTQLKEQTNNDYVTCLVGKWHLGKSNDYDHPNEHGVDEFMGVLKSGVADYYSWKKVENQQQETCNEYATTYFTDYAINWINKQEKPWLMWLAHVTPHTPYQMPPEGTYSEGHTGSAAMKTYLSMIENMDYEIGRLLENIPDEVLANTVVIFVGDNGTPPNLVEGYNQGKGSLYNGGVHVPMIISGKGVTLQNKEVDEQINVCDLFATMAHFSDESIGEKGGLYNSLSFKHLLSGDEGTVRKYNYMELGVKDGFPDDAYTIRDSQFKMIQYLDNAKTQELYDLIDDPYETKNLLEGTLTSTQQARLSMLEEEVNRIRTGWSCNDGILNGDEISIDCGGDCGDCNVTSIPDFLTSEAYAVFPNPFEDQLNLSSLEVNAEVTIKVYNSSGQKVDEVQQTSASNIIIDTKNYQPGIYYAAVHTIENQSKKVFKLIKK